ncbi:MAG: ABC transporter ATP-binding protein [Acidobacteriota bacterium]|jgi:zinc transport system ATP-binding protein|nr:ABC transporter ATP-binding protein [Acidobacteriota bacterium]
MALVCCENLTIGYEGVPVVGNLGFQIEPGDCLYIVGENGSGKSTLVKTILGLMKAIGGTITFDESVNRFGIGYLPQINNNQKNFPASVLEVVLSGCLNKKGLTPTFNKADKELVATNLEKLNILDLRNKCFAELSGGQKRRVLLARALCSMEKLLILDEPLAGLDPKAQMEFYKTLEDLNEKERMTIVVVSHDLQNALKYGKHVLHLAGDVTFWGGVAEYKNNALGAYFSGGVRYDG